MPRDGTLLSPLFTCRAGSQLVSPGHPTHALCQRLCLSSAQGSQLLVWLFGGGWAVLSCFSEAPLWPCLVHEGGGCGSDWSSISSPCSPAAPRQGGISPRGTLLGVPADSSWVFSHPSPGSAVVVGERCPCVLGALIPHDH